MTEFTAASTSSGCKKASSPYWLGACVCVCVYVYVCVCVCDVMHVQYVMSGKGMFMYYIFDVLNLYGPVCAVVSCVQGV